MSEFDATNLTPTEEISEAAVEYAAAEPEAVEAETSEVIVEAENIEFKKDDKKDKEEEEEKDSEKSEESSEGEEKAEEEDEDKKKKKKYALEEIEEYVALQQEFAELTAKYEALVNSKAEQETELNSLKEFKLGVERKQKEAMINETFFMLDAEDKENVMNNIDNYSVNDIEKELAVICFRKGISLTSSEKGEEAQVPTVYNLEDGSALEAEDDAVPAWFKAVLKTQENLK